MSGMRADDPDDRVQRFVKEPCQPETDAQAITATQVIRTVIAKHVGP